MLRKVKNKGNQLIKWWNNRKYWQKGAIIGLFISLIPLLLTILIVLINFGKPNCIRWEGLIYPICNFDSMVEYIYLIYFFLTPFLIIIFVVLVLLGIFIDFLKNKKKNEI